MIYHSQQYRIKKLILIFIILIFIFETLLILVNNPNIKILFFVLSFILTVLCSGGSNGKIYVKNTFKNIIFYIFLILGIYISLFGFSDKKYYFIIAILFVIYSISLICFIRLNYKNDIKTEDEKDTNENYTKNKFLMYTLLINFFTIAFIGKWDIFFHS